MSGLIIVHLGVAFLLLLLGWSIRHKKAYWLISGFNNRSDAEQQQLIQNGYPQKTGSWLLLTGMGLLILLPLSFTSFPYAFEVQFGFLLIFILSGSIYLSKYELPAKRKRSYIIYSTLFVIIVGFVITLFLIGEKKSEFILKEASFEITGMSGDEWSYSDITEVNLLNEMPTVTSKLNGFGTERVAKGSFKVEGYNRSILFIHKDGSTQVLHIEVDGKNIFINGEDAEETKAWYKQLQSVTYK